MFYKKLSLLFFIVFLSVTFLSAQNKKDYATYWQKVEALEKKGLTKTALEQVMVIYKLAKKDKNDPQQIKTVLYQIKYRNMVQEDSKENNIFFIDTLIAASTTPVKNILQNMQAEMYWQYLQRNRYKFYNRTKLAAEKSTDISTWSLDKLNTTIGLLYHQSLTNEKLLQSTKLEGYNPILIKGENTRTLRPTLYDFLAFRALDYFMNDERDLTKPSYLFTINEGKAFAPANEFISTTFGSKDSASLQYKSILLLQNIIRLHLKDTNPNALVDADLIRLNFVHQHAVNEDKNTLYEAALKNIEEKSSDQPAAAQAMYLRAQLYYARGQNINPAIKKDFQYEIKRAKELLELAAKKYPKTEGGINAQNLLNQILQPSLNLQTEEVNVPKQAFRSLVTYKNAKKIYLRIIKTSGEEIKNLDRRDNDGYWKNIIALKAIKTWNVALPDPQDFQSHAAEIEIKALETGIYFILSSLEENFSLQKNIIAKQVIYVSNISYINNNKNDYYILNRENGEPINNAQVQVWQTQYSYTHNKNENTKAEQYTTDKNGLFQLKKTDKYRNINFQIKSGTEELFLDNDNYYDNGYNSFERIEPVKPISFLFTDRSIYRPGQTIYFKGIVLNKGFKATETSVLPSFKTTLQLKDANNQKLSELQMVTNEFGSYHGFFKLPEGTLNGEFSLCDSSTATTQHFNVEEYKRPNFFVTIDKPTGTYRLMDSIKITGTAKAYSGNNIDGAKVSYRVIRKVRYPIWWGWSGYNSNRRISYPMGNNSEVEVSNGQTVTDSNGQLMISFKALPDESINKKSQPIFYYEVSADITDINGETRSGNTTIAVAYQMLQLEIKVPGKLSVDSLKNITVRSTNLNNIEENTSTAITIQQLKYPVKIFRERYWNTPDQFVMGREEYYSIFPYDVYKDENEVEHYEAGEKVYEKRDSTNRVLPLAITPLKAGWYKITAAAIDKYGEEVKAEKYIELYSTKNIDASNKAIEFITEKDNAEPGEKIKYRISSGFKNIRLIHTLNKADHLNSTTYQNISLTKSYLNEIDIQETDRGGIGVSYAFVQHNRVYTDNKDFDIPWSNKELTIDYSTFRDKILPGSNEKWKAKISGSKGEKVAAEILVSMYDASLDQFKPQGWSALNIWPTVVNAIIWSTNGFEKINSEEYYWRGTTYFPLPAKSYDQLMNTREIFYDGIAVRGYENAKRAGKNQNRIVESRTNGIDISASSGEIPQMKFTSPKIVKDEEVKAHVDIATDSILSTASNVKQIPVQTQIRKNFNETAFFLPALKTDTAGNIEFSFTMPEALTQWKLMTFAHTKSAASGYLEKTSITQKQLMVQPNAPRFLREGDGLEFSAKIVNLSDIEITGTTQLELLDAVTNKPVDGWFKNVFPTQYFTVAAGQSTAVKFPMEIPFNFNSALTYRITAKSSGNTNAGSFSDGEEMSIPVLTNRILVTESLPINLRNETTKTFKFEKLINSANSESITNHKLTIEYSTNPIWYAVQALPYLIEDPSESADQLFNRYYANTLAKFVSNSMPQIKAVFDKWRTLDTTALLSNLQKNEELKSALLQETPWVLDAQNETKQKQHIALLFDMVKMKEEIDKAINKLKNMQSSNGGFVWFKGGPDDRYITQSIITGICHLKKLNALSANNTSQLNEVMRIVNKAVPYLDKKIKEDYDELAKHKINLKNNNLSNTAIQYLYLRSFFTDIAINPAAQTAYTYYREQSKKYWLNNSKYLQAMIALALYQTKQQTIPESIIKSLKENAIDNKELGMYWKEWTNGGYYWYQAPIESQVMMIEAFTDIDKNTATINNLKTWLLKQKQTQNWKTTKATAEACYALLLGKNNNFPQEKEVTITLGNTIINSRDEKTETGTGYFRKTIPSEKMRPDMGNIKVSEITTNLKSPVTASWGAVYWQYFEDLDKITPSSTPLKLNKNLFQQINTGKGPVLEAIADGDKLNIGDKVIVRIAVKVDRDMEYVHMKDMRAACMEPTNVLSGYKFQNGLGYYESTNDASTNFFFGRLPRGSYIFEYPVVVTHTGNFSNGITSIQCMYAPEFTSHSEGIKINIEKP